MPTQTPSINAARYPALDGVRGLAVLMVLIWHYLPCQVARDAGWWAPYLRRILYVTGSGVDLFFALSGFLIVGILLDRKGRPGYFSTFYLRRTCRIFPLYFLMLGLYVIAGKWSGLSPAPWQWLFGDALPLASYATFTQNIFMGMKPGFGPGWQAVTWSLAVEEQFYLVIPLLVLLLDARRLAIVLGSILLVLPLLRMHSPGFHHYVNLPWRADPLLAGACVALLVRWGRGVELAWRMKRPILVAGVVLLALVGVMILFPGCLGVFDNTLYAMLYGIVILIARLEMNPALCHVLRSRTLQWLGFISFGIYLIHQPVSGLLHGLLKHQPPQISGMSDALVTLLATAITLILSCLSYHLLEMPVLRLAHRQTSR
ncbi:MAG: acyltransferase [Luteolibacter sp.]